MNPDYDLINLTFGTIAYSFPQIILAYEYLVSQIKERRTDISKLETF